LIYWGEYIERKALPLAQAERVHKNVVDMKKLDDRLLNLARNVNSRRHERDPVYKKIGDAWRYYSRNILGTTESREESLQWYSRMGDWHASTSKLLKFREMSKEEYDHILDSPVSDLVNEIVDGSYLMVA